MTMTAVRFDAAADRLLISTSPLDHNQNYFVSGWLWVSVDTNNYGNAVTINDNSANNADVMGVSSDGTRFMIGRTSGGAGTFLEATGQQLALNRWYPFAMVRIGDVLYGYLNGLLQARLNASISGRAACTRFELGAGTTGNLSPFNGRLANVIAGQFAPTPEQIWLQSQQAAPVFQQRLYGFWPMDGGATERARDYSGNGRNFTEGGTLTIEPGVALALACPPFVTDTGFYQWARPASDISVGAWTTQAGGTSDLYASIDEAFPDDTDYIRSELAPNVSVCEVKFSTLTDPLLSSEHVVNYRYGKLASDGARIDLTVKLKCGSTVIATWTHLDVTLVNASQTLSPSEADAITDYSDLRLRFEATQGV